MSIGKISLKMGRMTKLRSSCILDKIFRWWLLRYLACTLQGFLGGLKTAMKIYASVLGRNWYGFYYILIAYLVPPAEILVRVVFYGFILHQPLPALSFWGVQVWWLVTWFIITSALAYLKWDKQKSSHSFKT